MKNRYSQVRANFHTHARNINIGPNHFIEDTCELYEKLNSYAPNNPWVYTVIPAAVCSGLAALIYWLSNKPTIADFLIAAEGEIKKVSWSSRQEIIHSTMIVIVVVAIIAAGLYAVDMGFEVFFDIVVDLY